MGKAAASPSPAGATGNGGWLGRNGGSDAGTRAAANGTPPRGGTTTWASLPTTMLRRVCACPAVAATVRQVMRSHGIMRIATL
jgi:predicted phage gp36 major capsid-like protein